MRLGTRNPAAGVVEAAKKPGGDNQEEDLAPELSDQAQAKKLKSPAKAQGQEITSMGFRKRTPNPMMAGGRMRAKDLQTGSRKRGAY